MTISLVLALTSLIRGMLAMKPHKRTKIEDLERNAWVKQEVDIKSFDFDLNRPGTDAAAFA